MSLWDAVSGKILRWNTMKDEAAVFIRRELNDYIRGLPCTHVDDRAYLSTVRDYLLAVHFGGKVACDKIVVSPSDEFSKAIRPRFFTLTSHNYRALLAALAMSHLTLKLVANADGSLIKDRIGLFQTYATGVFRMYGCGLHYAETWYSRLPSFLEAENEKGRMILIAGKACDEISPILGISSDWASVSFFLEQSLVAGNLTDGVLRADSLPKWRKVVDAELGTL